MQEIYNKIVDNMPNCKIRHSQFQMVQLIDECFKDVHQNTEPNGQSFDLDVIVDNEELNTTTQAPHNGEHIALIEAPTGTGKSLAYLLAGILNAKKFKKKLVITTATKALQSQLTTKDIQLFKQYSGVKFSYAVAKGRSNYLCPYQLDVSLQTNASDLLSHETELQKQLQELHGVFHAVKNEGNIAMVANSEETIWDGDLDASPVEISSQLKPLITTDKDRCLNYSCMYNQKNNAKCPFYQSREAIKSSDVIITNHSLLLADLVLEPGSVLGVTPSEYLLCVDEGHSFADIAINSFTRSFELQQTMLHCHNLARVVYNTDNQSYICSDTKLCEQLFEMVTNLIEALGLLATTLEHNAGLFVNEEVILNEYLNVNAAQLLKDPFINLVYLSEELSIAMDRILTLLKDSLTQDNKDIVDNNINRLSFYSTVIDDILTASKYIINRDNSRYNAHAKWITQKNTPNFNNEFVIHASITHVGSMLWSVLWSKVCGAVITSATLSVGRDFAYYKSQLGLNNCKEIDCHKLDTSFMYPEQAQIVVPRFKFAPEFKLLQEFQKELAEYLVENLGYTEPYGTLVLFFNRNFMQEVYQNLSPKLKKKILLQSDFTSVQRLLEKHKQRIDIGEPSIIFGLNSLATGVDLPSHYCLHVIVTKLPFESYKDPQSRVREYWIRFEKGDYFKEVSLPEACIRLIQAAGRLIRSEEDYGQVTICDNRLVTKGYGRIMLDALPKFNRKYNVGFLEYAFNKVVGCG